MTLSKGLIRADIIAAKQAISGVPETEEDYEKVYEQRPNQSGNQGTLLLHGI